MKTIIQISNLHKYYGEGSNRLHVLKGLNFRVAEGEFCAITGPSGSGKSTLMNILGCMDKPSEGNYMLGDEDVARLNDDRLSGVRSLKLGFIFQSFNLINQLSVLENVELPLFYQGMAKTERRDRSVKLLESIGLGHRLHHSPLLLSGGECQRVAVARALVTDPLMILADEPTGNLDSRNGAEVMRLLGDLNAGGKTILIVTHDPNIAKALPRRIEIQDGLIVNTDIKDSTSAGN